MPTSGSVDWTVSRDDIIKAAFQRIGVVAVGGTPSASQLTEASLLLNGIVKSWGARRPGALWGVQGAAILPTTGVRSMDVGPGGGHITTSYNYTTTSVASLSTTSTITVNSTQGMVNGYYIGVQLTSGDMHWTTINGAPSGNVITLTNALTANVESGANVYVYSTKINRPLRIFYAVARRQSTTTDTPLKIVTLEEWHRYTNKAAESTYPLVLTYMPTINTGTLRFWPQFSNGDYVITFFVNRPLEDFDSGTNNPDFPQEYFLALVLELSCLLAPQYGIDVQVQSWLRREADKLFNEIIENDYEEGSLYFRPDLPYGMY